jgi:cyclomaltodextrinase
MAGQLDEFPPDLPVADVAEGARADTSLPESVRGRSRQDGTWRCTFSFRPDGGADSVSLAGDFNGWDMHATPMERRGDGMWLVTVDIPEGVRHYKFVTDAANWLDDPRNPDRVHDGHGGANSVLKLGTEANLDSVDRRRGDGRIEPAGLMHEPGRVFYSQRFGDGGRLLRYRTLHDDVEDVELVLENGQSVRLALVADNEQFDFWEALLPSGLSESRYTFILTDGDTRLRDSEIHDLADGDTPGPITPQWAKDAIWYQVMVDRFRNGSPEHDPKPVRDWRSEWYSNSPWEGRDGQTFYEWYVFDRLYGGDLQGLHERLDYLADLGVNALYLNPVFQAESHHKYNTTNYIHVDERYGAGDDYAAAEATEDLLDPSTWTWTESDRIFLDFIKAAKARGFRVIIDGVFNHVGTQHPAFRDVLERGEESPHADWFDVVGWDPFEYRGWAGFGSLPVFRKSEDGLASEAVKQHIFDVTRRWMDPDGDGDPSDGIDGWRLDVPNEIALPFWIDWCEHVRSINPDAYISGEIWDRADQWLDGRSFDAVMNYEFAKVAFEWIGHRKDKITPSEADRRLAELRIAYPAEVTYVLQNLIDSHDTDRAVSKLVNPDRTYDSGNREQEDPTYDGSKPDADAYRRLRLLALLQMTYVGAPMIYYGDEVGMWGSDDPNNRKPMLWQDLEPYEESDENFVDTDLLEFYKQVIALRREHPSLRTGDFTSVGTDDEQDVWMFARSDDEERILVALNAGDSEASIDLPDGAWTPLFPTAVGEAESGGTTIDRLSGRVWLEDR